MVLYKNIGLVLRETMNFVCFPTLIRISDLNLIIFSFHDIVPFYNFFKFKFLINFSPFNSISSLKFAVKVNLKVCQFSCSTSLFPNFHDKINMNHFTVDISLVILTVY